MGDGILTDFSKSYIANKQIIIVQAISLIDKKSDLERKTVGIQLGSSAEDADYTSSNNQEGKQIIIPEHIIRKRCSKLGMVFQNFNLFPHKTALENIIEAPVIVAKKYKQKAIRRGKNCLHELDF